MPYEEGIADAYYYILLFVDVVVVGVGKVQFSIHSLNGIIAPGPLCVASA